MQSFHFSIKITLQKSLETCQEYHFYHVVVVEVVTEAKFFWFQLEAQKSPLAHVYTFENNDLHVFFSLLFKCLLISMKNG